MKVYHGSYTKIDEIDLTKCELNRDFGRGFYVTNIYEQAKFWAKRKGKKQNNNGLITEFTFLESAFISDYLKTLRFNMNDYQAIDLYFNSKIYSCLIDESTKLYKKSWKEIYEMLKLELNKIIIN
ncbi:MAG: DUF3990 domain-containing protein [Bacteroidales bacterium]|nr:DUF3990 domain-containing protein [Bacteroidales bacterium]